jgi:hypothetical protein
MHETDNWDRPTRYVVLVKDGNDWQPYFTPEYPRGFETTAQARQLIERLKADGFETASSVAIDPEHRKRIRERLEQPMLLRTSAMVKRRRQKRWKRRPGVAKSSLLPEEVREDLRERSRRSGVPFNPTLSINPWEFILNRKLKRALKLRPHQISIAPLSAVLSEPRARTLLSALIRAM